MDNDPYSCPSDLGHRSSPHALSPGFLGSLVENFLLWPHHSQFWGRWSRQICLFLSEETYFSKWWIRLENRTEWRKDAEFSEKGRPLMQCSIFNCSQVFLIYWFLSFFLFWWTSLFSLEDQDKHLESQKSIHSGKSEWAGEMIGSSLERDERCYGNQPSFIASPSALARLPSPA